MDESLRKSILSTVCYFDVLDMPLTKEEVYKWLWQYNGNIIFFDFITELHALEGLEKKDGFYFLPGRSGIIENRQRSVPILEKKIKIARRAARKLRWIPFVRAMFVCNTVASASASEGSDIDVFIVIRNGRMWLSRFFVTGALSLFRLRRSKKNIADKICLSFYVTDDHLNLSDVKLPHDDIYLMYWIDQLIPVYDPEHVRQQMMQENRWVKKYLPNALLEYNIIPRYRVLDLRLPRKFRRVFETMWKGSYGDILEGQAKGFQKKKMSFNKKSLQHASDSRVVVSDTMLKFHENDRRGYFRDEWRKRVANQNFVF
ncbi:MAG: hypothetical protein ABII02_02045 [Candidatus Magasanikbacteria bacterium]